MNRPFHQILTHPSAALMAMAERPTKYRNRKITVDGIDFASRKEARRFGELQILQRAGKITDLKPHPVFILDVNGKPVCRYIADASYVENGALVVEDVKSPATRKNREYRIKVKLMAAVHDIAVREV